MKSPESGRLTVLIGLVCLIILFPSFLFAAAEKTGNGRQSSADFQSLEGKWVRPDGGYVLQLKDIKKDGSLTVAYYNPRPIRVFRAEIAKKNGAISLFVELRDVNYPGSTYNLQYDPASDRLKGTYFQAVQR